MKWIKLNVLSRLNIDKNAFVDMIIAVYQVKVMYNIYVNLTFIGAIENEAMYQVLLRLIDLLEIKEHVKFTKKSIMIEDMDEDMKKDYFFNFSVGNFVSYSGTECIASKLKTLFYNMDATNHSYIQSCPYSYCGNFDSLLNCIRSISGDATEFDKILRSENALLLSNIKLIPSESTLLKSIML